MDTQMFGDERSPLREIPQFRESMEKYLYFDRQVKALNERRGYLSWEETQELTKLKKMKLAEKDRIEQWKSRIKTA